MKLTWSARARTWLAELHVYIAQDSKPRALAMVARIGIEILTVEHYRQRLIDRPEDF
jgi:hypothetical protein